MSDDAHEYRVEVVGDTMLVWQKGTLRTFEEVAQFQLEMERACSGSAIRRALFDNRETAQTGDDVRDAMLAWVSDPARFDAIAVVLQSDMLAVRLNMDAIAHRVRVRAFDSVAAAQTWLDGLRKA